MSKLLAEIPVLDAGFVAGVSFYLSDSDLAWLSEDYFGWQVTDRLLDMPRASLAIKCPLFVNGLFTQYDLQLVAKRQSGEPFAYRPTVADVKVSDHQLGLDIAADISATTDALLLNPRAYQQDGCERFVAQVVMPISVYNQLVVSGSLRQWMELINARDLPGPVESYRKAIEEVLLAEWKNIPDYRERVLKWREQKEKSRE